MPAPVDHDARRADVARGVWSVLEREGFAGLSLRKVAAEMGATTGLIAHYFTGKDELVEFALDLLHTRTDSRAVTLTADEDDVLAELRRRLLIALPLDEETTRLNRIWISYWGVALADPHHSRREAARYDAWRKRLRPLVHAAVKQGRLAPAPVKHLVDLLTSATHGLAVQAVLDPRRLPPPVLEREIDLLLHALGSR